MKGKVLKMLKTKYAKLGLSEKTLEAMAATLEMQLADDATDEDIEAKVTSVENLLKSFQVEADRRATDAAQKAKSEGKKDEKEPENPEKKSSGDGSTPDIAKLIADAISPLVAEVAALKGEKVVNERKQRLETALEKIDPKIKAKVLKDFGRMKFDKDEEFDAYLEETVADLEGIGSVEQPKAGGIPKPPKPGKSDVKPTDEEIGAIVDAIL